MPWFITSICSNEVLKEIREQYKDPKYVRPQRTFGFFNTYMEAKTAISENKYNMYECLYDCLVLEYIEPGIHPLVIKTEWFVWDAGHECGEWAGVNKCPKEFNGIINFALG